MDQALEPVSPNYRQASLSTSPGPSLNINLDYNLFNRLSGTSSPFSQSPKRETSPSVQSLFSSDDDGVTENQRDISFSSASPIYAGRTPELVDLTDSPPLSQRNLVGTRSSTSQTPDDSYYPTNVSGPYNNMANTQRQQPALAVSSSSNRASTSARRQRATRPISTSSSNRAPPTAARTSDGFDQRRSRKRRRITSSPSETQTTRVTPADATQVVGIDSDIENTDPSFSTRAQGDYSDIEIERSLTPAQHQRASFDVDIEQVDLTEVNNPSSLANALSKQRQDAVKAQLHNSSVKEEEGRTVLTSYKCPICMDVLEDATSTVCGAYTHTSDLHDTY